MLVHALPHNTTCPDPRVCVCVRVRVLISQLAAKVRGLLPESLVEAMEGLAAIGYRPRPQVGLRGRLNKAL
jgi:hypothetical protein